MVGVLVTPHIPTEAYTRRIFAWRVIASTRLLVHEHTEWSVDSAQRDVRTSDCPLRSPGHSVVACRSEARCRNVAASSFRPRPIASGNVLTNLIVSWDIARSRRFYVDVVVTKSSSTRVTVVALANGWIVINEGGPLTEDKPTVTLTAPDPDTTTSVLNICVANIHEI